MQKNKDNYYINEAMHVYEAPISRILNGIFSNLSRREVAARQMLSGKQCLDIACGDGGLINNYLNKRYSKLVGVDISPDLIKTANKNRSTNTTFILKDIDEFIDAAIKKNEKYDDIYALAIIEHVQWPLELIAKLKKILKKGGRLIVECPNVAWLPHRISLLLGNFPITAPTQGVIPGVFDEHIRFFTFHTLQHSFEKLGFKHIRFDSSGKFRFIKNLYPSLLSPDILAVYEK